MPFLRKANVDKTALSKGKDRAELTGLWYLGSLETKILKDCTKAATALGRGSGKGHSDLDQKTNEKFLVIFAYENSCTILPMWYCSTIGKT